MRKSDKLYLLKMPKSKQTYLITVAIIEGRHYTCLNMDSVVIVTIGEHKKTTAVKKNSDCPIYNEVHIVVNNLTFSYNRSSFIVLRF